MEKHSPHSTIYDTVIRLLLILLIVGWCMLIIHPFASIILWSLILAIALTPLHKRLSKLLKGRTKIASTIIVISFFIVILIPCWMLIASAVEEVKFLKESYDNQTLVLPPADPVVKTWPLIGEDLFEYWEKATSNLEQLLLAHQEKLLELAGRLGKMVINATGGILHIMLSVLIAGILLYMGKTEEIINNFFRKVGGPKGNALAEMSYKIIGSVVKGIIGEAFVMAVLHGIFFTIAGVPLSGIWTILIFVFAVLQIPIILITGPMFVYFFVTLDPGPALGWSVALACIGFTDNILTPIMLGKGAPVPMIVIFIGAIGGLLLSGFIGLFTGAVVMSLGYTLFVNWIYDGYDSPIDEEVNTS